MIARHLRFEIAWSTIVQLAGKAAQIGLGMLSVKLVTNALGPEIYGLYGKIMEFSLFFSTVGNLGLFGNVVRRMAENPRDSTIFWNALIVRSSTGAACLGLGLLYLLVEQPQSPMFLAGTMLFMSSLLLDFMTTICDATLQAQYRMGRATLALVAGRLANLGTILLLMQGAEAPVSLFFLAPLVGSLVTLTGSLGFIRAQMQLRGHWNPILQRNLLWSSLPFGVISIINNIYFRFLPSALLARILNNSDYSYYTLNLHLSSTVSLFSTLLMFSVLPALRRAIEEKHPRIASNLMKIALKVLILLALGVVVGGSLIGPWALTVVSNHDFLSAQLWYLLPLLLLLAGISYFYDLAFVTLFALEKDWWWLKQELLMLGLALFIASFSFLPLGNDSKILIILGSAIIPETLISAFGLQKLRKELAH